MALVAIVLSAPAWSQTATVYTEQGQLVRASANVTSLGPSLMGDKVNLYTGSLEFSHTDVSLAGNNALPVSVGRRYVTGIPRYSQYEGLFVDWDLEIPHLHGIYAANNSILQGWVVYAATGRNPARLLRCSNFQAPPVASSLTTSLDIEPDQFWGGHYLYVPGTGDQKLLARDAANKSQPSDGNTYPVVTKSNWQLRCLTGLASPYTVLGTEASGEGFIALSPDGVQYRFDWMVSRPYAGVSNSTGGIDRQEVWILPTVVTDRFGNKVTYTYDTTDPWKLTSIAGSDGRTITLTYGTGGTGHRVAAVSDGTRTWRYTYADAVVGGSPARLTNVLLPDGSGWAFSLAEQSMTPTFSPAQGCSGSTWSDGTLSPKTSTSTITHPSGAVGSYTLSFIRHGRSLMSASSANPCPGLDPDSQTPTYAVRSLVSKSITGAGLSPQNWTFAWGPANGSFWCSGSDCAVTKTLTVTDARNVATRYTFGNRYAVTEGQLQQLDEGWNGATALRTTVFTYQPSGAGPYPKWAGLSGSDSGDDVVEVSNLPLASRTITQQATTFTWQATAFDTLARVTGASRSSSLGYGRTEATTYSDNTTQWVLGQVASQSVTAAGSSTPVPVVNVVYDSATALPRSHSRFGKLQASYAFNTDGTLSTLTDGANHTTTYSNYKRGLAQTIQYADGKTQSAVVNDIGLVTSLTNEAGTSWTYGYDGIGRLASITPPADDAVAYNPTTLAFVSVPSAEYGIAANHWRQTITQGKAVTVNYFDAALRKLLSTSYDSTDTAGTQRWQLFSYDPDDRLLGQSYPTRTFGSIADSLPGTSTTYDALGRPLTQATSITLDGNTTTAYARIGYVSGFKRQTTDRLGNISTASFQAFDEPSESMPVGLAAPQGVALSIVRDVFGKPLSVTKSGTNAGVATSVTRSYVYDDFQLLCKTIEPELGATLQDWDAAGNLAWRSGGTTLTSNACDRSSVTAARIVSFGHDARNRLNATTYGDGSPGVSRTYTDDGLPLTTTTSGGTWTFGYNNRRLTTSQTLAVGGNTYALGWAYDANGHTSQLTYPGGTAVGYSPNALGEAKALGTYASCITRFPNGAVAGYTYGNGIVHSLTQNIRGLPLVAKDAGIVQDQYAYDANDNVLAITDQQENLTSRSMAYDGLDRLTSASGIWGQASYTYDVQDNLRSSTVGSRTATHAYDASNRLTSITGAGVNLAYGYDANGNITSRSGQALQFDLGNRMTQATGQASYAYDGEGRRTSITNADGSMLLQMYSPSTGQLLFAKTVQGTVSATVGYSCASGTLSGSSCVTTSTSAATVSGYSCASGYTLSGTTCTSSGTSTSPATVSGYSCANGATLSGTGCLTTTTAAASIASYSCPSGYALSGSSCTLTTSSTSAATASYSCGSGQTLSGSTCSSTSSAAATPVYQCPANTTLSGSTCNGTTSVAAAQSYSCNGHGSLSTDAKSGNGYSCMVVTFIYTGMSDPDATCDSRASSYGLVAGDDSGPVNTKSYRCVLAPATVYSCSSGTLSGKTCLVPTTQAATLAGYTCSSGTLSGSSCVTTSTTSANVAYSCPSGQSLSGSTCTATSTSSQAATPAYACPSGYSLSGNSCSQTTSAAATPIYACPQGQTLSGSTCTATTSGSVAATPIYACPSGQSLSGSKCTATTSAAATATYSCPGNDTLSGTNCLTNTTARTTKYVWLGNQLIAEDDSSWGTVYVHTDGLGSPVARTNASGALISRTRYEPYGNVAAGTNPTAPDSIGFTGHVSDAGTGLTYMQQRYYDPVAGRFLSVDPVTTDTAGGFNRYAYVENNPYRYVDPDGRLAQDPQELPAVVVPGTVNRGLTGFLTGSNWGAFSAHVTRAVVVQGAGTAGGMAAGAACVALLEAGCGAVLPQVVVSGRVLGGALGAAALDWWGILQEGADDKDQSNDSKPQKPRDVPDNWKEEPGKKEGNTKWVNPNNPHDYVRSKPDGTVTQVRNGKAYDANGNRVDLKSPGAHGITPDQFIFRP